MNSGSQFRWIRDIPPNPRYSADYPIPISVDGGRTHERKQCARTPTPPPPHTHTHTPPSPYRYSMGLCQPTVMARSAGDNSWSLAIEINTGTGGPISPRVWVFFAYKKILGQTDTRIRERMYCQTIRTVRDMSRGDGARIATCSLRTPTDILKENYSIDEYAR